MCGCSTSTKYAPKTDAVQVDSYQILDRHLFSDKLSDNTIEIHVSCEDLVNKDFMSKSDPFAIIFIREKFR
jgi:hypothetical protein